jgi:hypothetical protein
VGVKSRRNGKKEEEWKNEWKNEWNESKERNH